ncbi:hypothetical protein SEA_LITTLEMUNCHKIN_78 [Gordonia phage LittleMunchkin]|nr:hypothetical protein SEA_LITTLEMUNCHKIN_78 [Gordonia phage LittleMunchkin]
MAPGYCCMTAANGEEYPGAGSHDYDCPVGGTSSYGPVARGQLRRLG